jgi:penicillin-binding protein 2
MTMRTLSGLLVLLAVGCAQPPAPEARPASAASGKPVEAASPSAKPIQRRKSPSAPQVDAEAVGEIVERALGQTPLPAAAVVLESSGKLVKAAGQRGADPARQALRPGSTVKPLLSYVAARAGTLSPDQHFKCEKRYAPMPGFHCYDKHGDLDLVGALRASCNAYFFDVAQKTGLQKIRAGFEGFGFGEPTGLVSEESSGKIPDDAALRHLAPNPKAKDLWPGFTLLLGLGHGPIQVTLAQLTGAYADLASRLTRESEQRAHSQELQAVDRQILQGMLACVGPEGTGAAAQVDGLEIAGKTGTAEPGSYAEPGSEKGKENGWFVGFAPAKDPEIVVGVLVLSGGNGGASAAPIAKEIFSGWQQTRSKK